MRYQLIAVSKIPDVVNGGSSFQVAAGVMEVDFENHILTTDEDILRLVDCTLLRDVDRHWNFI